MKAAKVTPKRIPSLTPRQRRPLNYKRQSRPVARSFETVTLYELISTLTRCNQSRQLTVLLGDHDAVMTFHDGQLLSARIKHLTGEDALLCTLAEVEQNRTARFFFEPLNDVQPDRQVDMTRRQLFSALEQARNQLA